MNHRYGYSEKNCLFSMPSDLLLIFLTLLLKRKGKRKVQGVPQSQTADPPSHQEEKKTDKTKQAQIEQTYEQH